MIKAVYEDFACLFMKYSDEILVTPPGLGKNFNPSAMPQLPNSTKEEMSMRLRLSSPSTTASLSCTFPKLRARAIAGNKKLQFLRYLSWDLVATRKGSHSCWYSKKPTGKRVYVCTLTCRDWPHQAALRALTVLLGTSVSFLTPISGNSAWQGLYLHRRMYEAQQGI